MSTQFSQRDPRWANDLLGFSRATIGKAGCLLTCVSTIVSDWGVETHPGQLNAWLRTVGGFVNGDLLAFGALTGMGVRIVSYVDCATVPAPVTQMRDALAVGQAVFAAVDWSPGGWVQTHWVRVLTLDEREGKVMDPWQMPGGEVVPLSTYLAADWDPARGIFEVLISRPASAREVELQEKTAEPLAAAHQKQIYLRRRAARKPK